MRTLLALSLIALAGATAAPAEASRYARYGVQDDAWLEVDPQLLETKLDTLDRLGVKIVRYTLRWDRIAAKRPEDSRSPSDPAYDWGSADVVLEGLRERNIQALVTILGAPRWTNGNRPFNWAPRSASTISSFAYAAGERYPWVRDWLIWNEPNQRRWLLPTSPRVYVKRILNPAYASLHRSVRGVRVGGGATAPRGNEGGVSPVSWIRGMRAAGARLDAYAHHPYPLRPRTEGPTSRPCGHCTTMSMAALDRLLREVRHSFGGKRIWLTEYGYQTSPPDRFLGVSEARQARYLAEAAEKVYRAARVDMLIHFLVRDDTHPDGWQSGLFRPDGSAKLAERAYTLPLAQRSRHGDRTVLWGQVRPRSGRQPYRLRQHRSGRWVWVGGTRRTDGRGFLTHSVLAGKGARFQIWSPRDRTFSATLTIR